MIGQVYKVHSDKYLVKSQGKAYDLRARGSLKKRGEGISVGDYVNFEKGVIVSVEQRTNHFIRPNVSNVDLIVAVVSPEPKPDFYLIDKLLISAVRENVEFIIVVNKTDVDIELTSSIKKEYNKVGVSIYSACAKNREGITELKELLKGKLAVLAGQSAAGKTSLVNAIFGLELKTGDLSEKTQRGKHTTTRSEIFEFGDVKIIDSPGFAAIEAFVPLDELPECYPEYFKVSTNCKFRGCSHISEPYCEVKKKVDSGEFSLSRYQRYKEIYEEISKRREIYEKD